MAICKYYMQGSCRFGENCKFEHQLPGDHSYATPTSILLQNKPQTGPNVETSALVKSVVNDMTSAEKGGQWLLSIYAPFKEKPQFPGFEDHSMEEIRYLFYQARASGSIEQYKQHVQGLLQQAVVKIRTLQNPSPEIVNMLRAIYNTPASTNAGVFQGGTAPPVNQTFQNQSIFGGSNVQQSSIFGGNAPPAQNQSIFGGQQQPQQQQSIFGGNTSAGPGVFGGASSSNSIFGGGTPQVNNSIFGGNPAAQPASNNSIFGGSAQTSSNNPIFGGGNLNPQSSFFGGAQPTVQNTMFNSPLQQQTVQPVAAAHTNSIFGGGAVTTTPSIFGAQPSQPPPPQYQPTPQSQIYQQDVSQEQAIKIMQQNSRGGFFNAQSSEKVSQYTASIFGNSAAAPQPQQNIFGGGGGGGGGNYSNDIPDDAYSKPENLTDEEKAWFQNDDLDPSKIPDNPPTRELCFV